MGADWISQYGITTLLFFMVSSFRGANYYFTCYLLTSSRIIGVKKKLEGHLKLLYNASFRDL